MVIPASIAVISLTFLVGYAARKRLMGIVRMEPLSQWWLAQQRNQDLVKNC